MLFQNIVKISKLLWKGEIPTTFGSEIMTSISFWIFQIKLLPTTEATIALTCHLDALNKSENLWTAESLGKHTGWEHPGVLTY